MPKFLKFLREDCQVRAMLPGIKTIVSYDCRQLYGFFNSADACLGILWGPIGNSIRPPSMYVSNNSYLDGSNNEHNTFNFMFNCGMASTSSTNEIGETLLYQSLVFLLRSFFVSLATSSVIEELIGFRNPVVGSACSNFHGSIAFGGCLPSIIWYTQAGLKHLVNRDDVVVDVVYLMPCVAHILWLVRLLWCAMTNIKVSAHVFLFPSFRPCFKHSNCFLSTPS